MQGTGHADGHAGALDENGVAVDLVVLSHGFVVVDHTQFGGMLAVVRSQGSGEGVDLGGVADDSDLAGVVEVGHQLALGGVGRYVQHVPPGLFGLETDVGLAFLAEGPFLFGLPFQHLLLVFLALLAVVFLHFAVYLAAEQG